MKIVYLLKSFAAKGGEERVMADKMNYLAEHGHEVTLITSEQGQHELVYPLHHSINHVDLDTRFFTITNLPLLKKIHSLHLMRKIYIRRLTAILNELRPDIMTSTIMPLKNIRLTTRVCMESSSITSLQPTCGTDQGRCRQLEKILQGCYSNTESSDPYT